jgi:NADH-quinone oxidoreductase subunit G
VLRVLGNLLGLPGFAFETSDEVRAEALGDITTIADRLGTMQLAPSDGAPVSLRPSAEGLERIADVPIYSGDAIVRRAPALQHTADARPPVAGVPSELAAELGIADGSLVRVHQGDVSVVLPARVDPSLAANVIRVAAGHPLTAALGPMFGTLRLERVAGASGAAHPARETSAS